MPPAFAASARALDAVVDRVERSAWLDAPAEKVAALVRRLVPSGVVEDLASGTPSAHPAHPPLTALTIGAFTGASLLDLLGGEPVAARRLTGIGLLAAIPTILTGANDWLSTAQAERRVGLVHAAVNDVAITLMALGYRNRRRGRHGSGAAFGAAGFVVLSAGGWLGGHLAYALGVGVDTTAFSHLPQDWTDVASADDVPAGTAMQGSAGGAPVLLTRTDAGIVALADRCTHRGGPLHEGELADGAVTCPWHGSRFRLTDGSVTSGPAVRPAPVLETRVVSGRVQVRRPDEPRALRLRPVGS
jgi:nitrite reductase/ring-hydroxylating ferredoxin subunit/uncharacterized membrane protein